MKDEPRKMTWGDLFDYLEERCNIHEDPAEEDEVLLECSGGYIFVLDFCDKHGLGWCFDWIYRTLWSLGGGCDCLCLTEASRYIKRDHPIEIRDNPLDESDSCDVCHECCEAAKAGEC